MVKKKRIYLDTAAGLANPSSLHREGVESARVLANARARVAACLGAHPDEIVFTSGGTEANNLAIFGTWTPGVQVITTAIEHASVLEPAKKLGAIFLPVNHEGLVDLKKLKEALTPQTRLVSIIYAHNEIGVVQPIREITKIIRHFRKTHNSLQPYFHLDACQAPRFLELNVERLGVDLLTINAGKIYGPRGVGALYVRRGVKLQPLILGGGQESGRRAGTENVAGAIGLAKALETCASERESESQQLTKLRDQLISDLLKLPGVTLNGPRPDSATERLPNNVNVSVAGFDGEQLVIELDARGIAASTGAACSIPERDGAYVIMALGKSREAAESAVRFTLGRETKASDIKYVLKTFKAILNKYVHLT